MRSIKDHRGFATDAKGSGQNNIGNQIGMVVFGLKAHSKGINVSTSNEMFIKLLNHPDNHVK